ncbi:penicillin-binding protein 1C [Niveispirillum irakense]|uniref:penicillin-binding protein 1C n=1 Tax=Niveispirillum irakense TaxID=34011 RepID=UPI0004296853|nr:penicillin-binding protein 1C [Niveispirillum irakense]
MIRLSRSWRRIGIGGLAAAGLLLAADLALPPDLSRWQGRSAQVLDANGGLLRPFPTAEGSWRLETRPDQVDPLYLDMLLLVEDGRHGWHPGVDPLAVIRAGGQALRHGRIISGASTLSMQAARLLSPQPRTFRAKLEEAARALQLHRRLGAEGVLSVYLTLAPFGGPLEGVRAASLSWFGREPAHLSPAQSALLVALPQSPERLRPDRFPAAARAARNRVLDRAAAAGLIAADVAAAAKAEPLPTRQSPLPLLAPHLAERLVAGAGPGAVIRSTIRPDLQRGLEALGRAHLARLEAGGDLAILVLDNRDRRLLAHLGSGDWQRRQLDLSRAVRSPGSTLKPFIYALAFDDLSLHPGTLIDDAPQRFGDWLPRNFDHDFHGMVTAREALQRSLNVPAVQVLERVGPARMAALLTASGANLSLPPAAEPGLPLALGGVGIRLTDLAMLYAALADDGKVRPIQTRLDGPTAGPAGRLVGGPAARATLTILRGSPMPDGLAGGAGIARTRRVAFKTGTSYGYRDAWTVGVSTDYTVAVWVGRADGAPRPGEAGRQAAAPLMFRVFDLLPPDGPQPEPAQPDHALFRSAPPPALARLNAAPVAAITHVEKLRILFPPDGAEVEALDEGISLSAQGGRAPYRWVADDMPLAEDTPFWRPTGAGFSRLTVIDATGQRASAAIRVHVPGQ